MDKKAVVRIHNGILLSYVVAMFKMYHLNQF